MGSSASTNRNYALGLANFSNTANIMFSQLFTQGVKDTNVMRGYLDNILHGNLRALPGLFQQGFNPQEMAALNTLNTQGTANSYNQALQAMQMRNQQLYGGNVLPSGTTAGLQALLGSQEANQISQNRLNTQLQSDELGQSRFMNALGQRFGLANMENSEAINLGSIKNNADQLALTGLKGTNRASPLSGLAAGLAGGLAGMIPGVGPILAPMVSSAVGGAMSGGSGGGFSPFNFSGLSGMFGPTAASTQTNIGANGPSPQEGGGIGS